jgi:hypothetical protein
MRLSVVDGDPIKQSTNTSQSPGARAGIGGGEQREREDESKERAREDYHECKLSGPGC